MDWYLGKISEKFIFPIEEIIRKKKLLIIVPHRNLHHLPFSLLFTFDREYLISKYEIVYLSGPRLLKICHGQTQRQIKKMSCLIIADPTGDLNYARAEAKSIKKYIPKAEQIIGKRATKEKVMAFISKYNIIHFACHARFNIENPIFSHLLLSGKKDGLSRMEVNEIFNLKLKKANLVILSACESALGMPTKGDEITCLTRAFIYAGAPSVIVTLWEIDDEATAELMGEFYKHFSRGEKTANAIRLAQIKMMKKYQNPYLWAGFQLVGAR